MASFSVPCPKISSLLGASLELENRQEHRPCIASFPRSDSRSNLGPLFLPQGCSRSQSDVRVCAQLNEVVVEKISNSAPAFETQLAEEVENQYTVPDAPSISAFMTQVADLVKLVDSKDIMELQLKQMDCEVLIRKKEALPQPSAAAPVFYAQPSTEQAMVSPQLPPSNVPAPASHIPSTPNPVPAPPALAKPKSSHPPVKCPMAGTFYRASAPGATPFVKVGDKVQKGQVVCIIEAMKLMNEIEADQSGTVVDILVDDGKPVSVDMPLFVIEP
ncbi:biotin carboxyl carrier protein of acetyl-CoA carboxylase 2, chloroplastic-like [Olea europaea var. sylvestris]|uniref:biotin carboxyl carrier protein of acetyl-CoA carboxylase 2, chloroplastic-like n=1 Tax=Olea europaea var. sylvestris TaxID=158386 RepID=UPI000C1D820D|nr:biotin carboxyl carrier protein of acetyl-CoA carboxylase 2, chloroplastic-like [Olea europaea var. sylvestris]